MNLPIVKVSLPIVKVSLPIIKGSLCIVKVTNGFDLIINLAINQ